MTDIDLKKKGLEELRLILEECAELTAQVKARQATIQQEINDRLMASAIAAYEQQGKDTGTIRLPLQDGLEAKVDRTKRVDWDSDKLMALASTMPWERVQAIFKVAFAVPETVYKGIGAGNPDLKKKIDEARTVKIGEPKITLTKTGD